MEPLFIPSSRIEEVSEAGQFPWQDRFLLLHKQGEDNGNHKLILVRKKESVDEVFLPYIRLQFDEEAPCSVR